MKHVFSREKTAPVVSTRQGKVRGYCYDDLVIFKGIPYAQAKRFHAPQPVAPWEGIFDAGSYGMVCPLLEKEKPNGEVLIPHRYWPTDENCQNLNIWTPGVDDGKRPVLVWLHGGGFSAGSSIEQVAYDGANMARLGNVVVVSVNHRLNILGYFDLSEYGEEYANSGNAGGDDIIAALSWVHDNIAAFGGDPECVTVFGQSGGGAKVTTLLQSPAADGLYAVRDGERWSLFSTKTGNIMMQDAAQQMPYLYGTNELSVWLDDEYYNYDNFAAMREKCEGLNAELQANGAEIEVLYDGVGGYANRWIYTEDGQIYYDLLGTYEFSGTPLVQVSDASALFGVRPATWDNEYRCYTVANGAPYAVARSDGSLLSSFRYKNVCMAGDELIAVEDTDGNWGYCDINGEEVIPCTYQAAMQAEGASEPIDYPFPDMSGVVVVQDADGARMALYTDGTVCIEAGRFEDLAPAQGGCVWARQNGQWGLLEVK